MVGLGSPSSRAPSSVRIVSHAASSAGYRVTSLPLCPRGAYFDTRAVSAARDRRNLNPMPRGTQ